MPNLDDYLLWRGDLPLDVAPFTELDALALSLISYVDFPPETALGEGVVLKDLPPMLEPSTAKVKKNGHKPFFGHCRMLLDDMAVLPRYRDVRVHHYVSIRSAEYDIQFSAITLDLPTGERFVSCRGTDYSIVGWRENFTMAFESPVPSQAAALQYLEEAAKAGLPLMVGGHSKGGNLASYAAAHLALPEQDLIQAVYSFDSPGLDDATFASDGYARIRPRIKAYIPQYAIVGLLLAHHEDYQVVQSDVMGVLQHDAFTWQVEGPAFLLAEGVDPAAQLFDHTLHAWLTTCSPEQRALFVNTLFDLLETTHADTLTDLLQGTGAKLLTMLEAAFKLDRDTKKMLVQVVGRFVTIGAGKLFESLTGRNLPQATHTHLTDGGTAHADGNASK